jgi:signal transduction histidine kinase
VTREENRVLVGVQDFGIGIPEEYHSHIFKRFYLADNSNSGAGLNLGLGLYISKEIVHRTGGEIWFESEVGTGSTFYFSLPC